MSLFGRLLRTLGIEVLERRSHPANPDLWLINAFRGQPSAAGMPVTESNALSWTPLMSGVRFLAETQATLPLHVYQRTNRGKDELPDHPIARLYRNGPNPEQDWTQWMQLSQCHCVFWGNAYSKIVWNGMMEPVQLWPLNPDRVQLKRNPRTQALYYQVSVPSDDVSASGGGVEIVPFEDMLHVSGFSRWGLLGERLTAVHKETIGLGLATEVFGALLFGQGANPSGILTHPGELSKDARERLEKSANEGQGLTGAHMIKVFEEGMKWQQVSIDPEKAQYLGLREFQVQEAARILRLPPHLLYDLSRATFTNIEHQGIEVVTYTLLPWARRWEARLNKTLISEKMKNQVYTRFKLEGLLRGDLASRYTAYATGRQNGWLSANDIRELEDMNPIPKGDTYLQPANMVPLGTEPAPPAPPPVPIAPEPTPADAARNALPERLVRALETLAERDAAPVLPPAPLAFPPVTVNAPVTVNHDTRMLEVLGRLAEQKPPEVRVETAAPVIQILPTPVTVEAPKVTIEQPKRKSRTLRVKDGKGKLLREAIVTDDS